MPLIVNTGVPSDVQSLIFTRTEDMEKPEKSTARALRNNMERAQANLRRLRENTEGLERTLSRVEKNLAKAKASAKAKGRRGSKRR
jgi:predicted  nucleic acid-binding Zn-ribbon protein